MRGRPRSPSRVTVLTYHGIRPEDTIRFSWQIRAIARHCLPVFADYQPVTADNYVAVTFDDAFEGVFTSALPILRALGVPAVVFVPTGYIGREPGWLEDEGTTVVGSVATASELKEIDHSLYRLGSHTVMHPHLTRIADEEVITELQVSKRTLEELCGDQVDLLSLPFGSYSPAVLALARQCGYRKVFLNVPTELNDIADFLIGRVDVSPVDWRIEFLLKIHGCYGWLGSASALKRSVRRACCWKSRRRSFVPPLRDAHGG